MEYRDIPRDRDYCTIDRSHLDPRVWVPHIPYMDIASSEGMATTSIRAAKAYIEGTQHEDEYDGGFKWEKVSENMWCLFARAEL